MEWILAVVTRFWWLVIQTSITVRPVPELCTWSEAWGGFAVAAQILLWVLKDENHWGLWRSLTICPRLGFGSCAPPFPNLCPYLPPIKKTFTILLCLCPPSHMCLFGAIGGIHTGRRGISAAVADIRVCEGGFGELRKTLGVWWCLWGKMSLTLKLSAVEVLSGGGHSPPHHSGIVLQSQLINRLSGTVCLHFVSCCGETGHKILWKMTEQTWDCCCCCCVCVWGGSGGGVGGWGIGPVAV